MINILLYQILASAIHGKIWTCHIKTIIYKMSGPTWSKKIDLPDVWHSVSDTQDYCEYTNKNL